MFRHLAASICVQVIPKYIQLAPKTHLYNKQITFTLILKNGGHLGRHLGFLKTPPLFTKVPGSLINFRLCRTF